MYVKVSIISVIGRKFPTLFRQFLKIVRKSVEIFRHLAKIYDTFPTFFGQKFKTPTFYV